jgi:hypothetical protein
MSVDVPTADAYIRLPVNDADASDTDTTGVAAAADDTTFSVSPLICSQRQLTR